MRAMEVFIVSLRSWVTCLLLFLSYLAPAAAQEPVEPLVDPESMIILQRAAQHMADAARFSVTIRDGYDVVQANGQKIEFGDQRQVLVNRPNQLRVDIERSDGKQSTVVFDGKNLTAYDHANNVYAQSAIAGDVDAAIKHFVRDLRMRLPLAMLLVRQFPTDLKRRVQQLDYVEETVSRGVPSDHLAARGADVDFQIWIAQGEQPLIQRVVLTYKLEEGAPQFWAEFSDWNFNPAVPASKFEFQPPADAQAHSVSGQLRRDRPHEAGTGGADRRNAMNSRRSIQLVALVSAVLLVAASFHEAEARGGRGGGGRGGGGGYSRGGAAAGGGFSSRGGAEARSSAGGQRQQQASAQRTQSQESRQTQYQGNQQNRQSQHDSNQQSRQDRSTMSTREDRQDYANDAREDRQDYYDDEIDDDWDRCCDDDWDDGEALVVGAVVVGAAVAAAESSDDDYVQSTTTISALPCTPAVQAINGVTYYTCGSSWYNQVYSGGGVSYITVQAPPGY